VSSTRTEAVAALGELTMVFQHLENDFRVLFSLLLCGADSAKAAIVSTALPFGKLVSVTKALLDAADFDQAIVDQIRAICSEACTANEERNRYVHSFYDPLSIGQNVLYEQKKISISRGSFREVSEIYNPAKLTQLNERIAELCIVAEEVIAKLSPDVE
jgi:hypothetical protein